MGSRSQICCTPCPIRTSSPSIPRPRVSFSTTRRTLNWLYKPKSKATRNSRQIKDALLTKLGKNQAPICYIYIYFFLNRVPVTGHQYIGHLIFGYKYEGHQYGGQIWNWANSWSWKFVEFGRNLLKLEFFVKIFGRIWNFCENIWANLKFGRNRVFIWIFFCEKIK